MSLHIESTENALAELKKQRTKTLTAAISVSFLGIALMGLLLYLCLLYTSFQSISSEIFSVSLTWLPCGCE